MDYRRTSGAFELLLRLLVLRGAASVAVTEVRLSTSDAKPYVVQGESATLICQYVLESTEEVTEVEWEKEGALVYLWTLGDEPVSRGVLEGKVDLAESSPSSLTITKVHMDMQGTYTCRVRTNGKTAHNEMFLMVIVDACSESSWKTHTDMIECTEDLNMHCVGIFPKPSPACGVYSERTGKYLSSVPFDSVNVLHNGTYEVSFNRRFSVKDWLGQPDLSFRCYMIVLGTPWRTGITHKMFGDPGCEKSPPSIPHGHFNVSGDVSCWGYPGEGSNAEYHCSEGYQLLGTALFVCSQGQWVPEGVLVDEEARLPQCSDGSGASCLTSGWILFGLLALLHARTFSRPTPAAG